MTRVDRIGNVLRVGDNVVAYSHMRTGSSTRRMVQYDGTVTGFHKGFVLVRCDEDIYGALDNEFRVHCRNVFRYPGEVR